MFFIHPIFDHSNIYNRSIFHQTADQLFNLVMLIHMSSPTFTLHIDLFIRFIKVCGCAARSAPSARFETPTRAVRRCDDPRRWPVFGAESLLSHPGRVGHLPNIFFGGDQIHTLKTMSLFACTGFFESSDRMDRGTWW